MTSFKNLDRWLSMSGLAARAARASAAAVAKLATLATLAALAALAAVIVLGAIASGCSSKSPTEPALPSPSNPKVPVPVPVVNVTVTASPAHLVIGTTTGSNIVITARLASNGQAAPDLTAVVLTTTLGEFGAVGSGTQTLNLQLVGGQATAVLFPGASAGTAAIAATINSPTVGAGSGSATVRIDPAGVFFLSSVSPNVGTPTGGDVVTITGGGFIAPVTVTFAGNNAQVRSVSSSQITVTTPPSSTPVPVGQTLTVNVTVTNNIGGSSPASQTLNGAFTYALGGTIQQPQVFSVIPASGTNDGGTRVQIIGQGFASPVQVLFGSGTLGAFNGVEAAIQQVTPTQIVVITPAANGFGQSNRNQTVSILVKNLANGFATIATQAFKYGSNVLVTSEEPSQTVWNQQVKVIVFGQGFLDPVAVGLAGVAATVLSTSGTEIQVLSPIPRITSCTDLTGPVQVVNVSNGDGAQGPNFTFIVPKPQIFSIVPNSGPGSGNTQVIIDGQSFDVPNVSVTFDGVGAVVDDNTSTSSRLVVTTPAFTGTFPTQPCVMGTSTGTMNIPIAVNVVVTNTDTTCTFTAAKGFIYTPTDASCHIAPPPPPTKPQASFTFVNVGKQFQFTDTSTNNPTSWSWTFGDAGTSAAQNPSHLYAASGMFIVTLTVSNAAGSSEASQVVTVP
jgi:hypothetical protein